MSVGIGSPSETDLDTADSIFRIAFGTFLERPDPKAAFGDSELFRTRYRARKTRVFAAPLNGTSVGSNARLRDGVSNEAAPARRRRRGRPLVGFALSGWIGVTFR